VPSKCSTTKCGAFEVCDPLTGSCANDPCEGVKCPTGQSCNAGQCQKGTGGKGGAGGSGGGNTGGSAGSGQPGGNGQSGGASGGTIGGAGTSAANGGNGNVTTGTPDNAKIGLATGGGGCRVAEGEGKNDAALTLLGMIAAFVGSRRRASKGGAK